jgi:[ribosomal protein S5]-alanine N-acetyltransferase
MIETPRMRLVPATVELIGAEIDDRASFAELLAAVVPANWPPETLADALPWFRQQIEAAPEQAHWRVWYGVLREANRDILVASVGFMGPPQDGGIEVGYSVLPDYQRRGLAAEMTGALIDWALAQPGVERVAAEVDQQNTPSLRLIARLGFEVTGAGRDPGHLRFERGLPAE